MAEVIFLIKVYYFYNIDMRNDTKKIIQALAYLAYCQPSKLLDNMKAYKLLWLVDRCHLRQTGRTVTGDSYYAMPYGIVPSDAKCILEGVKTKLRNNKRYERKYIETGLEHQYKVISEPDMKVFSESDQAVLDKVLEFYNGYNALELSDISHRFPEWQFYQDMLKDKNEKNSYKVDFDHFFEAAPDDQKALFNEQEELLELTKDLYHQYNRV